MKYFIGIHHPKQVYFFKNIIYNLIKDGHEVLVIAVDKEVTEKLLMKFDIDYALIGRNNPNILKKISSIFLWTVETLKLANTFQPDMYIGRALPHFAYCSYITRKPYIILEDTEIATNLHHITVPFAKNVITPSNYKGSFKDKHVKFNSNFELCYLHPNYFTPDPTILTELGLQMDEKYIILRFISFNAYHDKKLLGIKDYKELIEELNQYGRIFISTDFQLPKNLEKYRLKTSPEKIHSVLYYSQLYMGDGGTMATEAAILGTPAIHIESTIESRPTGELSGNLLELRDKYDLLYFFADQTSALHKAHEILDDYQSKVNWRNKSVLYVGEKIDATKWLTEYIEHYI
ncbi:MAG: DUF354 domain-containing protein [Candidatus Thermoplasmatota archaeon]|nr:DUF354 domain-containing protein [Candidatus Thermoplasmatota archaeon]